MTTVFFALCISEATVEGCQYNITDRSYQEDRVLVIEPTPQSGVVDIFAQT